MKNINLKIFIIAIFLFSFSAFTQDSLAMKSKCDSLKVVYKTYLEEWKNIETNMKNVGFHSFTNDYSKLKHEWDSLFVDYRNIWKVCELSKERYFQCLKKKDYEIHSEPPPPPPPSQIRENEIYPDAQNKPELIQDTVELITNYIIENYPDKAKKHNLGGTVIVKFICSEEGVPTNSSILSEKPDSLDFGLVALEAIKLSRWEPAKDFRTGKPIKIRWSQKIKFEPPKKESSKCDSLQAAYEEKLNEWKWMRNKMGKKDISEFGYDSILQIDLIRYNDTFKIRQEYCNCSGDSIDINREPTPPPPFVNKNENPFKIHTVLESGPEMTQESKSKIIEFLDKAYSGKGDKVSGEVTIKFVCTKEGIAHSVTINKEKPVDMGFGKAVIEAMKYAEFIPAKEKNGEAVNIRMALHFYFYNRENNRVEIK
ncbi:TPA: hypothetical protein DCR49_04415 [Candidatus Delongbacteria bacterium]|nr:hypothetical protein [Candidatus Delongbacteria bacterium]